jgi:DNA-directed RNA polymerase alpha subunit
MKTLEIKQTMDELRVAKEAYFRKVNRLEKKLATLLNQHQRDIEWLVNANRNGASILEDSVNDLDLSIRAHNVVLNVVHMHKIADYRNVKVKHLLELSEEDFAKSRNCGAKSLMEIKQVLFERGLELKNN